MTELPVNYPDLELIRMEDEQKFYPFRKATLTHYDYDIKKSWYITYYAFDVQLNRMRRARFFKINHLLTVEERKAYARQVIRLLNKKLADGYHFDSAMKRKQEIEEIQQDETPRKIVEALNFVLDLKSKTLRKASIKTYRAAINIFIDFLRLKKLDSILAESFELIFAKRFFDYLLIKEYPPLTVNLYTQMIKTLFNELMERKMVKENPFRQIKKLKEGVTRRNIAFTEQEIETIRNYLKENNKIQLLQFTYFIYSTFIRPAELILLKVKHVIKTQKGYKIFVPSEIAKTKYDRYCAVPKSLQTIIESMNLEKYDKENYLFGDSGCPGTEPLYSNQMYSKIKVVYKNLEISADHTLYSWKHTGVIHAYQKGIGLKAIQLQCGHHSLDMTDKYLKSLGLQDNDEFSDKFD